MLGQGSGTDETGAKKSFEEQFDWQLDHSQSKPRWVGGIAGKRASAYWALSSSLLGSSEALDVAILDASGNQITTFGGHEYQEDSAHVSGDWGIQSLGVRKDTAAALGANGDYTPFTTNARAATWVAIEDGAGGQITSFGGGTEYTEDAASPANPTAAGLSLRRRDTLAAETTTDGDWVTANSTNKGELYVKHVDTLTVETNLGKAEDAGHSSGDTGIMALGVANTADANISGTTLDYTPFATDLTGAVHVMGKVAADAAAPANPLLVGGYAANTLPTAMSADADLVWSWHTRAGAQVVSNALGPLNTDTKDCASVSTTYRFQTSTAIAYNVRIQAPEQNIGVITFGGSSTFANNFMRLRAGETFDFGTIDLSLIYFGSSYAGDDLNVIYTS